MRIPGEGAEWEVVRPGSLAGNDDTHLARWGRTLCNRRTGLTWTTQGTHVRLTCEVCKSLDPRTPDNAA
jgi:hypothetical protein